MRAAKDEDKSSLLIFEGIYIIIKIATKGGVDKWPRDVYCF